ncbi:MAG TPA: methylmalonyl-CoA mutase [Candidatus Marinimicrobia bacterium]|jgi:methylmalonyl-CoA mutase N-terminal domain/subunit|nr:methylmalonyl-CoA mutase [Candidatus Neomarinimicrobiota bacterium]HIL86318.1 methylmalonyl-CoA mutase [Candidatus Neomarinimicrobiota bacterium]
MSNKKIGKFPFTKGIYKDMYRNRLWTMRQYAGFSSVSESNKRYLSLLESGVSGLSIAFDLPTQMGYDSNDDMSYGEIGKSGVPISTPEDIESLFNQIDLEKVSVSMTINSTASILLAFYISLAKKRGYSLEKLRGTLQNDILKEYIARGTYIFPINHSLRLTTDIFEYCQQNLPNWNSISVSGYHIREAGSTAVQELAFTFANAITYLEAAKTAGIDIEKLTTQISFFFNSHRNFFEEIAKFRAAREIWAHIVRDRFKIANIKSQLCRFHVQTAGSTLTAQQIDNNTPRTTLQSLAAVLGGAQSIHTNGKDEALSLPSEKNALSALRIQQVIAYESGIPEFIDPVGDSSLIDSMTKDMAEQVNAKIDGMLAKGGVEKLIQNGTIQNEISESSIKFQNDLDDKKAIVVGVNKFISKDQIEEKNKPQLEEDRSAIIENFKSSRNEKNAANALALLKEKAKTNENLMPYIIECSDHQCTLGEISSSLKNIFGEYSL